MKKLLVVGAGQGQIPIIKRAKELGIYVLSVDKDLGAKGIPFVNYFECIDVVDLEAIEKLAKDRKIDGIMTYQSDIGVATVGHVSDKLKLPGVSFHTAQLASNKILSREKFAAHGVSQPKFSVVADLYETVRECNFIGFPCIIKAADSSGSRGVTKVNTASEIPNAYQSATAITKLSKILVEEFVEGIEIGAQTFCRQGEPPTVLFHNDTFMVDGCLVPTGHSMPIKNLSIDLQHVVKNEIIKALESLNISSGPSNVDLIIKENKPYIIEIGARAGATCLPELVFHYSQIDWEKASIESALGLFPDFDILPNKPTAVSILFSDKDGYYQGHEIDGALLDELQVVGFEIEIEKGEKVSKLTKGTDRIGRVICSGSSASDAENNVELFIKSLKLKISDEP